MTMLIYLLIIYLVLTTQEFLDHSTQQHLNSVTEFKNAIVICQRNFTECESHDSLSRIIHLSAKLANEFSVLLLHEGIDDIFKNALSYLPEEHVAFKKLSHIRSIIHFSQGYTQLAQVVWPVLNQSDLSAKRSQAVQMIMVGHEKEGFTVLTDFCNTLLSRFENVLSIANKKNHSVGVNETFIRVDRVPSSAESEELLLSIFLNEVQGDAEQRFRLGVGLAKLGLYDLSLRHVSMSATPWESPLYKFRAKLVFQPVHGSIRALAMSVDNFERMGESILAEKFQKTNSRAEKTCNSLNQISLAIQALPLLHLAGYSSPRDELRIGHSAIALPVLLSEVYNFMCASTDVPVGIFQTPRVIDESNYPVMSEDHSDEMQLAPIKTKIASRTIKIGFISGSFDGLSGKVVLAMISPGIVQTIKDEDGITIVLTAMCLPTPRSTLTDMANGAFHNHINLPPENKSEAIVRIRQSMQDLIIFADAGLDSRVFALAHERMASYQAILWGWGGTLGIPTIDYYFVPETLWRGASCAMMRGHGMRGVGDHDTGSNQFILTPQELFHEQVVLLDELPFLPLGGLAPKDELEAVMKDRFRLPPLNESNIYLFPGSVRHVHPEFDTALSIILRTDTQAYVIITLPRMGRDSLPTTHIAGRHDLMHPTHPPAAVEKLKQRLKNTLGVEPASRVRILPPLDETIFSMLLLHVIAVLDPFPVGMHIPITEAFMRGVPVVSAPKLQECTNSHAYGIANAIGIQGPGLSRDDWPSTAEDYAVLALRLTGDHVLRQSFLPPMTNELNKAPRWSNPRQHQYRGLKMVADTIQRLV